jgi:hypothetical protein
MQVDIEKALRACKFYVNFTGQNRLENLKGFVEATKSERRLWMLRFQTLQDPGSSAK